MNARFTACALLASGVIVGAEVPTPISARLIQPIIQVKYVGAAPAGVPPQYIDLIVEEDGGLSSLSHQPPRCQRVPPSQVRSLAQLLNEASVREALTLAQPPGQSHVPYPRLILIRHGSAHTFSAAHVPVPIRRVMEAVDTAFARGGCKFPVPAVASLLKP
jgi:hypothetical protein